jgi:hypothetical protein
MPHRAATGGIQSINRSGTGILRYKALRKFAQP